MDGRKVEEQKRLYYSLCASLDWFMNTPVYRVYWTAKNVILHGNA